MPRPSSGSSQRGFEESESEEDTSIVVDVSSDDSEAECEVFLTPEHTLHKLCAFDVLLNASTLSTGSFNVPRVGESRSSKYRHHAQRRQHELQFRDHRKITTFFSPAAPKVVDTSESDTDAEEYVKLFVSIGGQHMLNLISILVCFLILEWKLRLEEMLQRQHV